MPRMPGPGPSSAPQLIVLTPLRLEQLAVGGGRKGPATLVIERTGMGLAKAAQAARGLSATSRPAAVAIAGLGGALNDNLVPGDLIVAERLLDATGREVMTLPSAALLAAELRRSGLRARTGTVLSTDHIVTGAERGALCALGADVVDMESTAVAEAGWGVPLAVLRAVSDSPGVELFSPAGARGVYKALLALRASRRALADWAAAVGPKEIFLAEPRSFCAGVRRAIETVERALVRFGPPVYVRRQIVHNAHVVSRLEVAGAVFVEELDEVPDGANVVFSAHGVGTSVMEEASRRHMSTIDATCPLVTKVHTEARRFSAAGRQLVLIGHAGHDEIEGTLGTVPTIALVSRPEEVAGLDLDPNLPTALLTQTTLATDEVAGVVSALEERFLDLARPSASDICYASQNRQEAVRAIAPDCDLVLVVGSQNSSNSNRLVEVARRSGARAQLVDSKADLCLSWLAGVHRIGITAGASAPEHLVEEVVDCLSGLGPTAVVERSVRNEHVSFPLPMEVR
jgi:4-hydroxy-3-methylbut-2-en-1-yl diphosphate reductase